MTDPRGAVTSYSYNQRGQVVQVTSRAVSGTLRYAKYVYYDGNDNVVRVDTQNLDETGAARGDGWLTVNYTYDVLDYLTQISREADNGASAVTQFEYDGNWNLSAVHTPEAVAGNQPANVITIYNDERDLPWRIVQAAGTSQQFTTQLDYDGLKNVRQRILGLEGTPRVFSYQYDGLSQLEEAIDPAGNQALFQYDADGQLVWEQLNGELQEGVSGTNVRLRETSFAYDPVGRLTTITRALFDPATQNALSDGSSVTTLTYTPASRVSSITDDRGNATTLHYDNANRLQSVIDALGNSRQYAYDANGNVVTLTDTHKPDPNVGGSDQVFTVTSTYDGLDRLITRTDGSGNQTHYAYDSRNQLVTITDPAGSVTAYGYDALGRPVTESQLLIPEDPEDPGYDQWIDTTRVYDLNNRVVAATDGNGNETQFTYDARDQLVAVAYPDGTVDAYTYTLFGDVATSTDPKGTEVTNTYDALSRLTARSISTGAGVYASTTWETFTYDGLSRIKTANNNAANTSFTYDSMSNVLQETLAGNTVQHTYDGMGNTVSTQYPGGTTVNRVFDELNRITSLRRSGESTDLAGYNYVGPDRVLRRDLENGTRLSMTYDGIQGVQNPAGDHGFMDPVRTAHTRVADNSAVADFSYLWDAHGNKTQGKDLTSGGPTFNYYYDLTGRLYNWTKNLSGGGYNYTVFSQDHAGNRTFTSGNMPDSGAYTMDSAAPSPSDAQMDQYTTSPLYNHTYDAAGNLLTSQAKNSFWWMSQAYTNTETQYDYQNRPVAFTAARSGSFIFSDNFSDGDYAGWTVRSGTWDAYDEEALIETATGGGAIAHPQAKNDVSAQFQYTMPSPGDTSQTAYVDVRSVTGGGNDGDALRLTITPIEISLSQHVNGSWSALGSPVSVTTGAWSLYTIKVEAWGGHVRVWRNQNWQTPVLLLDLTSVTQSGSSNLVITVNSSQGFQFDEFNVHEFFEAKALYAYDALGRRIRAQTDGASATTVNYVFDGWQTVQERNASGALQAEYVYGNGLDEPLVLRRGGQDYFYHADELGNVLALTNSAGQLVEKYSYGPYGEPEFADGSGNALSGSAVGNPLLFNGREYDTTMRLYNYRMRWLDPRLGRFTTRDPMGAFYDPWALGNPYTYVGNSPWDNTDPLGLLNHSKRRGIDEWWDTVISNTHAELPTRWGAEWGMAAKGSPLYQDLAMLSSPCDPRWDEIQSALNGAGFVPGVGDFADLLNAAISRWRGDDIGFYLSITAAVPVAGGLSNTVRASRDAARLGKEGEKILENIAGVAKNTESWVVNGRVRIPDFVTAMNWRTRTPFIIYESKNTPYQWLSTQLRDYRDLVGSNGKVYVALPPRARVSRALRDAFADEGDPLTRIDLIWSDILGY